MLARNRRVPTLAAAMALGVVIAAGTAAAGATPAVAGAAAPFTLTAAPQISTLPNGDRVVVTGSGPSAATVVLGPDGRSVPATRFAPDPHHAYVIPDSVVSSPAQFVASQYQIPALTTGTAPTAVPHYAMGILQVNGVGLDGAPAQGLTYLADVDDVNRWNAPLQLINGVARVAVPAGHYNVITQFGSYDSATGFVKTYQVTQLGVTVVWPNSGAKGSTPWLKVTASDALGGSIAQTVDNAYTIG